MPSHSLMITVATGVSSFGLVLCLLFAASDWPKFTTSKTRLGNSPWLHVAYLFLLTNTTLQFCTSNDQDVVNLDALIIVVIFVALSMIFIREWKKTH
jgi:hypothetical protein